MRRIWNQMLLLDVPPDWKEHWEGMRDYEQGNAKPTSTSISVAFRNDNDRTQFLNLLGERPDRAKSIWYPHMDYLPQSVRQTEAVKVEKNRYPIYIISKGRWEQRMTNPRP